MNKYAKTLFRIILAYTIVLSSALYINELNEWFFYKNIAIKYFIFIILAVSVLGIWPIILELYTEIDITDSNLLFLNIALLTICVLKLIREIYDK